MELELPFVVRPCPTDDVPLANGSTAADGRGFSFNETGWGQFLNGTYPCWTSLPKPDMFRQVMNELNIYFTPVIIIIGMTGNLMSFLVFAATHLSRQSSSIYLASLALADMGFLTSLLIIWLS